ncbi:MAG: lysophospholipid acyltransferase family protein [Myxococcota bacterium]
MLAYRIVQTVLRGAIGVFFRQVHVVGLEHVPDAGEAGVVFAGNHPNSLIDPVLVLCTSGRIVHFAAKDKLFRWPLAPILKAVGAVPIARKMDYAQGGGKSNDGALDALRGVLSGGKCVGIFPEGLSHNGPQLARLRKGAARIALGLTERVEREAVVIVPTGLTYVHRKRFRSRVLVQYGAPILIDDQWAARWRADSRKAAQELTDEIEGSLRALTVNAPDWETLRVLDGVRRLYQPAHIRLRQRIELARRFCEVYPSVADDEAVKAVYRGVDGYLDRLELAGLTDRDLVRGSLARRSLANLAALALWLPLALPGALLHLPLGLLVGWAGLAFAPRKDVVGTSRLIAGMVGVLALYAILPMVLGLTVGWGLAVVVAVVLPVSGYATLRVLERGTSLRRLWHSGVSALMLPRVVRELRAERKQLEDEVVELVRSHMPADMAPLFPGRLEAGTGS